MGGFAAAGHLEHHHQRAVVADVVEYTVGADPDAPRALLAAELARSRGPQGAPLSYACYGVLPCANMCSGSTDNSPQGRVRHIW